MYTVLRGLGSTPVMKGPGKSLYMYSKWSQLCYRLALMISIDISGDLGESSTLCRQNPDTKVDYEG